MSKIEKFSVNNIGIDYICSDIHGHFSLLDNLLHKVNFDAGKDRLFSLGDLIDRGDESHKALEYLRYPWFHAILGNHELMLIKAYKTDDLKIFDWWYYWGGDWAESLSKVELKAYYEVFKRLPVAIELSLKNQRRVGLVHAQLPSPVSWNTVCDQLSHIPQEESDPESFVGDKEINNKAITEMLWAKTQIYGSDKERAKIQAVQDIDHVFHGHSIVYGKPETITNRTFMDLGSYETGEIGFIDPVKFLQSIE